MKTAPVRLTLGRLAKACGLARASVLHYEALGLLQPAGRTPAGYRVYGAAELDRLQAIRRYREAGLPLETIRTLLAPAGGETAGAAVLLEQRLLALSGEIEALRAQQRRLATLLALPAFRRGRAAPGKDGWVGMLRRAGFDEDDMRRWHADFEAGDPRGHRDFLRALGLSARETARIRAWSAGGG